MNEENKKRIVLFSLLIAFMVILVSGVLIFARNDTPELSAKADTSSVTLSWTGVDGANGYIVSRVNGDEGLEELGDTKQTTCLISGLNQNTKYSFVVSPYSYKADGSKKFGNVSETLEIRTEKVSVKGFSVDSRTESSFTFSWKENDDAVGYRIFVKGSDDKYDEVFSTEDNTVTTATISGLTADTSYTWIIQPYTLTKENKKIYGAKSSEVTKKTNLPTVTGLKAVSSTTKKITISFDAVEGAEKYEIYCKSVSTSDYKLMGRISKTETTISNCNAGTRYLFRVKAISASNSSQPCEKLVYATVPTAVTNLKVSKVSGNSITVKWDKVSDDTSYLLYAKKKGGKWKSYGRVTTNYGTVLNLKEKTKYSVRVIPVVKKSDLDIRGAGSTTSGKTTTLPFSLKLSKKTRQGEYISLTLKKVKFSDLKWEFSNSNVELESDGLYAAKQGKCVVSATYKGETISWEVTITKPLVSFISATYDLTNDRWIYRNRINERCYPGSNTKLITALTALKYCDKDTVMTVGDELSLLESDTSRCGLYQGEELTLEQLLYGMLLPSGCDAANTIAANVARTVSGNSDMSAADALKYFAELMTDYVKSIGGTGTNMVNAHGYPYDDHYTTAHDMVLVARKVRKNATLRKITSTASISITSLSGNTRTFTTTNALMKTSSKNYYEGACGMKTGTIADDYRDLIGVYKGEEKTIISVVYGATTNHKRYLCVRMQFDEFGK